MESIEKVSGEKDREARKYQLTFNNPMEMIPPMSHSQIKIEVAKLSTIKYWCLCDEIGIEEHTPHTHVFVYSNSPLRFSTLKRHFPQAHIESAYSTCAENRNYLRKEGKWSDTEKRETSIEGSFEEFGEIPSKENISSKGEMHFIYDLIESGYSTAEILRVFPEALRYIEKIDRARQLLIEEEYKNTWRNLEVTYIFGATQLGKTRFVMETWGYSNVYRITDYMHPFDSYKNQKAIIFEEFRSSIRVQDMLNYLDGYPCELPARYNNKVACYLNVYIISNIRLEEQYENVQRESPATWQAFLRRIHKVIFYKDKDTIETYNSVDEYFESKNRFQRISEDEQMYIPFNLEE